MCVLTAGSTEVSVSHSKTVKTIHPSTTAQASLPVTSGSSITTLHYSTAETSTLTVLSNTNVLSGSTPSTTGHRMMKSLAPTTTTIAQHVVPTAANSIPGSLSSGTPIVTDTPTHWFPAITKTRSGEPLTTTTFYLAPTSTAVSPASMLSSSQTFQSSASIPVSTPTLVTSISDSMLSSTPTVVTSAATTNVVPHTKTLSSNPTAVPTTTALPPTETHILSQTAVASPPNTHESLATPNTLSSPLAVTKTASSPVVVHSTVTSSHTIADNIVPSSSTTDGVPSFHVVTTSTNKPPSLGSAAQTSGKGLPILLIVSITVVCGLTVLVLFGALMLGAVLKRRHHLMRLKSGRRYTLVTQLDFTLNPLYKSLNSLLGKTQPGPSRDTVEGTPLVFNLYRSINPDTLSLHSSLMHGDTTQSTS